MNKLKRNEKDVGLYENRINYIIDKILFHYSLNISKIKFLFNFEKLDQIDFEFDLTGSGFCPPYVSFLNRKVLTKDLRKYCFAKYRSGNHLSEIEPEQNNHNEFCCGYKFPTRWIFEDFEEELTRGFILNNL